MSDWQRESGLSGDALDRYITGNYGEDQFDGYNECEECGAMVKAPHRLCGDCGDERDMQRIKDEWDAFDRDPPGS